MMIARIKTMVTVTRTKIMAFALLSVFGFLCVAKSALAMEAFAQPADPSFDCLLQLGPVEVVSGFFNSKFKPRAALNKKFDARSASFEIPGTISHSIISLDGSGDNSGMCWAGGYVTSSPSWHDLNISWDQSKHGNDGDRGTMNNTTSATCYENRMTWTGMHVYNVHDGIRTNNTYNNWTVQHVWFDYIRDDCLENDHIYSGTVYDSLFDGCYTGISVRPSSSGDGQGETITIDKVLLRMEPMPYPYKWETKDEPTLRVPGYGDIPFAYGKVFKIDEGNEPDFNITDSVFLLEYDSKKTLFPPKAKVSVCRNNTIIWLGNPADAPTYLLNDFPGCFTIMTDKDEGKNFWKTKVADWHARHPGVGVNRKPANPGEYIWPRFPPTTVSETQAIVPTVSITAPDEGATVSGTVLVMADASDNVGEVRVQFKVNGVDLGNEIPTAPYLISWDTVAIADGPHQLSAIARDAAGNTSLSDTINVMVNNAGMSTLSFVPIADATIISASPNSAYGTTNRLEVDNKPVKDFLIKFLVTGIAAGTVTGATLRLFCTDKSDRGGDFFALSDHSWSEESVTWNNAPLATSEPIASLGPVSEDTWAEVNINVSTFVTGDGTYSFRITSDSTNGADYSSREDEGLQPQLIITVQ